MEQNHPINDLMSTTIQKIRDLVDANTIVGAPIQAGGVTLIPVSKLSFGFGTGGSDFAGKNQKPDSPNSFGGGGGAGVKVVPVAFLVVNGESVKLLPMTPPPDSTVERIVDAIPDLVDKVADIFDKKSDKGTDNDEEIVL